jgi:putative transposase
VLGQFSRNRAQAERAYRQFVSQGIGKSIWQEVRGQAILGEEAFGDKLVDYLRKQRNMPEIPRSQRYVNRPALDKLFTDKVVRDKKTRNRKIAEAAEKHLYSQRQIADHLGIHYSSVSRIVNGER